MELDVMLRQHQATQIKLPNLLVKRLDKYTVDVFADHDVYRWSRYGYSKGKWHFQKGERLDAKQLKELSDGFKS